MANSRSPFDTYPPFGGESSRTRRTSYDYEHFITEDDYVPDDMPDHILYEKLGITLVQDDDSDLRHSARHPAPTYVDNKSSSDKPAARSAAEFDDWFDSKLAKKIEELKLATKVPSFAQVVEKPSPPPLVAPAWTPRSLYVKRGKRQDRPELLDYRIEIDENNVSKIFTHNGKIPRGARWCRYHYDGSKQRGFDHQQHKGCLPRDNHLPCELQHDLDDCEDFALDLTPDDQLEEMVLRSAYMDVNKGKQWPNVDAVLADIRRRKVSPQVQGIAKRLGMEPWPKPKKGSLRAPRETPRDYRAPNLINDKKSSPNLINDKKSSPNLINDMKPSPNLINDKKSSPDLINDKKSSPNLINDKKSSSIWNDEFMKNEEHRKQKQFADYAAKLVEDEAKKAQEADKQKKDMRMHSAFQNAIDNFARALRDQEYADSEDGQIANMHFARLCTIADDKSHETHVVAAEYLAKLDEMVSAQAPPKKAAAEKDESKYRPMKLTPFSIFKDGPTFRKGEKAEGKRREGSTEPEASSSSSKKEKVKKSNTSPSKKEKEKETSVPATKAAEKKSSAKSETWKRMSVHDLATGPYRPDSSYTSRPKATHIRERSYSPSRTFKVQKIPIPRCVGESIDDFKARFKEELDHPVYDWDELVDEEQKGWETDGVE